MALAVAGRGESPSAFLELGATAADVSYPQHNPSRRIIDQPDIEARSTLNLGTIMSAMPADDQREDTAQAPVAKSPRPRIVIVGGGFAGIAAARALRRADAEIILIDQRNHHI